MSEIIDFTDIVVLIDQVRENTFRKINEELVMLYWNVGKYVHEKIE